MLLAVSNGGDTTRLIVVLQSDSLREQNFDDKTVRDLSIFEPLGTSLICSLNLKRVIFARRFRVPADTHA